MRQRRARHALKAEPAPQLLDRAARHRNGLTPQLELDLPCAVDGKVAPVDTLNLGTELVVAAHPLGPPRGIGLLGLDLVVRRRGD